MGQDPRAGGGDCDPRSQEPTLDSSPREPLPMETPLTLGPFLAPAPQPELSLSCLQSPFGLLPGAPTPIPKRLFMLFATPNRASHLEPVYVVSRRRILSRGICLQQSP